MRILSVTGLSKTYNGVDWALKDVSFEVWQGNFLILLGLSGSGKSTLLRCINRLVEPDEGAIQFQEREVFNASQSEIRQIRRNIGMIFQQFNLVKNLSVLTNVLSGRLGYHGLISRFTTEEHELALHNLERVGLVNYARRQVKYLSGGQQQRVAIARALMQQPSLILADEPVASLDPATADSIMQYLGEINRQDKITIICSLHFLSLARKYGNRVLALKDGRVVYQGIPTDIDEQRFREIYGQDAEEVEIR
ncbi:MAG: phosphonate ABC transporter ATP-binding protein [Candidatus Cloacimonetes bacterium]|nr:phosphonate ABC transporter ATP-binding protein [Candidatus Cloacimonadota bacterium]